VQVRKGLRGPQLEPEPVAKVGIGGQAQVSFDDLTLRCPIHVDVDRGSHCYIAGEESSGTLEDPSVIDEVEPFEQTVICHLPLKLLERPATCLGEGRKLVGQSTAKGGWATVGTAVTHACAPLVGSVSLPEDPSVT
jgi:hypothetical protein